MLAFSYNSLLFPSMAEGIYNVWYVNDAVLSGKGTAAPTCTEVGESRPSRSFTFFDVVRDEVKAGKFTRISLDNCIDMYGQDSQSGLGDVLLVTHNTSLLGPIGSTVTEPIWISSLGGPGPRNVSLRLPCVDMDIDYASYLVDYCYVQQTPEACRLYFIPSIGVIVVLMNLSKAVAMLLVAMRRRQPLLTVGDAVASFLEDEDIHLGNSCLESRKSRNSAKMSAHSLNACFEDRAERRLRAVGSARWWSCIVA
jgi:hypothetical protein